PQWVQTSWLASQSRMNSICSHFGHFSQRFSGASLRATSARSLGRTKLVSQFMAAVSHEWPSRPRSAPEAVEGRHEIAGFPHLAEQFPCLIVSTEFLRRPGFQVGDDGGLARSLARTHGQDPFLAEPREAQRRKMGLALVERRLRRAPV